MAFHNWKLLCCRKFSIFWAFVGETRLDKAFPGPLPPRHTHVAYALLVKSNNLTEASDSEKEGQGTNCSKSFPGAKSPWSLGHGCSARRDRVCSVPSPPGSGVWPCLSCRLPALQSFLPIFRIWFSSPSPCASVSFHYCFNKFPFSWDRPAAVPVVYSYGLGAVHSSSSLSSSSSLKVKGYCSFKMCQVLCKTLHGHYLK